MFHDAPVNAVSAVRCRRTPKSFRELCNRYKLEEVASFVLNGTLTPSAAEGSVSGPFLRVALQFPDDLLDDSVAVVEALKSIVLSDPRCIAASSGVAPGSSSDVRCCSDPEKRIRFFVVADNTFGSCCPDEITAQHYQSDCLVHFGEACMSRSTRIPVFYVQDNFSFAVVTTHISQRQQQDARDEYQQQLSVRLVVGSVGALQQCLAERLLPAAQEADPEATISLVVVGSHRSRDLVESAARVWCEGRRQGTMKAVAGHGDGVTTVWCTFELLQLTGTPATQSITVPAGSHSEGATGTDYSPSSVCGEHWVLNGVRVPRAGPKELQFFLFVGPSSAAIPLHLLSVHEYNVFHCPESLRELAFESSGLPPVLTIMDESFGVSKDGACVISSLEGVIGAGADGIALEDGLKEYLTGSVDVATCPNFYCHSSLSSLRMMVDRRMKQRAFNIELIRGSSALGIVVTSLAISGYYETTMLLHRLLRKHERRAYIIYIGHLNEFKMANFVDTVDCFVAIACPNSREGHFPDKRDQFPKPVVSPIEVILALCATDVDSPLYGHPAAFNTTFDSVLPLLRREVEAGSTASRPTDKAQDECMALIRTSTAGALMTQGGSGGSLARLYQRTYVGLDPRTGQTPVQPDIEDGLHGIARGYATEGRQEPSK